MTARLRLGLAGLGSMGRNHLRVISNHPDATLAAVADPDPAALEAAVSQTGARGFADPLAMIAEAEIDGVVVAAPTTAPPRPGAGSNKARPGVLVEKPLAATVEDGLAIVAGRPQAERRVQVGHVERYNPAVMEMGRLLRAGWLSTIYAITSRRAAPSRPASAMWA